MHWLPTQERKYLPLGSYPKNLVIRLSNAKNNTAPGQAWTHWSTVVDKGFHSCPAQSQGNQCGTCRRLLVQRGEACHIPETLTMEAPERARPLLTRSMKHGPRPTDTGHKLQASSRLEIRGASFKPQAASFKLKATSRKLPDP